MTKGWKVAIGTCAMVVAALTCQARIEMLHTTRPAADVSSEPLQLFVNQKEWALAASAILMEVNNQRHDLLGGEFRNAENIESRRMMLSSWWSIESREDLLETLAWLKDEGHRKEFSETGEMLFTLTPEEVATCVARAQDDEELLHQFELVREFYPRLGSKSLMAWDLGRYIALCRWGYLVGYFSEDEAWARIMPAARMLRQHFSSWGEMADNYLLGREYWSYNITKANGAQYRQVVSKLLRDPSSPWCQCPWGTDLERTRLARL